MMSPATAASQSPSATLRTNITLAESTNPVESSNVTSPSSQSSTIYENLSNVPLKHNNSLPDETICSVKDQESLPRLGLLYHTTSPDKSTEEVKSDHSDKMELSSLNPVLKSFIIGSTSGACSTVLFQPLDLLKTRLQQSPAAIGRTSGGAAAVPQNFLGVFGHIIRTEKLWGLWKGMTPSLTRCVPGVGIYFASLHGLKTAFDIKGEPTAVQSVLLGVSCRSFSGLVMMPFTVIKTRFESRVYQYGSIQDALRVIYRTEGIRGLTCGVLPTLLRDAPFSGLYLLMFTTAKKNVPSDWLESNVTGPYVRFSCGIVAGIGASVLTQPADVIKTKMQLYPDQYNRFFYAVTHVYHKYGAQGYFKGLMPRMIRRTLIAAMSWTVYEQLMRNMGLK